MQIEKKNHYKLTELKNTRPLAMLTELVNSCKAVVEFSRAYAVEGLVVS